MKSKIVEVKNATGLHARPASGFAKLATAQKCEVFLEKDGNKINAKSILGILTLAIGQGSKVTIITDGVNEEASLKELVDFVGQLED
ncbi:catabolite repression HPr-like protein [Petrocella atlantisensis]|uniref:Phosphocarrier protein HPr n=1 Tax=Petrocella atlantisensis TaxID=2173034 RepID=A0A3P7S1S4_9FIRM|nr:HPr family phosphocarrier protein [Petrocella atlantisensis]MCF8019716.1 HPr family phosphocarrier protein [Vallitaleaceae bacterium]VDN48796.1 catabolite repression HPr-like protein [Petrocella atlantisensis]